MNNWKAISIAVVEGLLALNLLAFSAHQDTYGSQVQGTAANGAAVGSGWPIMVAGTDGSNRRTLSTDSTGKLQVAVSGTVTTAAPINPCQALPIQSTPVNVTSATTVQLVAPSGSTVVTICGYQIAMVGTIAADTFLLEYGTGATCGTGTVVLTGAISSGILTAGATPISHDVPLRSSAAGAGACIVTTIGTGPQIQGVVNWVQG